MTPEQALQILNRMAAVAPGTRQDHLLAQQAVEVLRALLPENVEAAEQQVPDG